MNEQEIREAVTLENDGEKIFGILHTPVDCSSPGPAVLICPGFAGSKAGKYRLFVTLAKILASNGIAVFRFDYRGSGDSEGEFEDITVDGKVNDTLICLDFLAGHLRIDPTRLGILGRSLGGVIAVLTARRRPTIKSMALWAPVFKSDPWRSLWDAFKSGSMGASDRQMLNRLPGNIPGPAFLEEFFRFDLEKELRSSAHIPLLHIHGDQDTVVTVEHARDFENARSGAGRSRFVHLPRSDHDFSDKEERDLVIEETVQWFLQTL